jgi:hypothetical protein
MNQTPDREGPASRFPTIRQVESRSRPPLAAGRLE